MKASKPSVAGPRAIRDRLRQLIADDGRTQAEVAAACGMGPSQLNNILSGAKEDIKASTLERILTALGLDWSALNKK